MKKILLILRIFRPLLNAFGWKSAEPRVRKSVIILVVNTVIKPTVPTIILLCLVIPHALDMARNMSEKNLIPVRAPNVLNYPESGEKVIYSLEICNRNLPN